MLLPFHTLHSPLDCRGRHRHGHQRCVVGVEKGERGGINEGKERGKDDMGTGHPSHSTLRPSPRTTAQATAEFAVAIGKEAEASGVRSIAIGFPGPYWNGSANVCCRDPARASSHAIAMGTQGASFCRKERHTHRHSLTLPTALIPAYNSSGHDVRFHCHRIHGCVVCGEGGSCSYLLVYTFIHSAR
jgi:hypothetical protein